MEVVLLYAVLILLIAGIGFSIATFQTTRRFWNDQLELRNCYRYRNDKYVLLLRSFSSPEYYSEEVGNWVFGPGEGYFREDPIRKVTLIIDACWDVGIPVMVGPMRIKVSEPPACAIQAWTIGDDWFDLLMKLADGAKAIIIVPEESPSLIAEFEHIRANERLLMKTLFVIPPVNRESARWQHIVDILDSMGVRTQTSLTGGALCMSCSSKRPYHDFYFKGKFSGPEIRKAFGIVGKNLFESGQPVSRAIRLIEEVEHFSGIVGWYIGRKRRNTS